MKDKQMEKLIDACYDVMFQREEEMRELGLLNYGDSAYYIQNPEEYEKDKKICELENEVERLKHKFLKIEREFKETYKFNKQTNKELKQEIKRLIDLNDELTQNADKCVAINELNSLKRIIEFKTKKTIKADYEDSFKNGYSACCFEIQDVIDLSIKELRGGESEYMYGIKVKEHLLGA